MSPVLWMLLGAAGFFVLQVAALFLMFVIYLAREQEPER